MSKEIAKTEETTNAPVTAAAIHADCSAFTVETRGLLASIGGKILAFGKAKGLEKNVDTIEALLTEGKLQRLAFDKGFIGKAIGVHGQRKSANAYGADVYKLWAACTTDKGASAVLFCAEQVKVGKLKTLPADEFSCIQYKESTKKTNTKTDAEKLADKVRKLNTTDELKIVMGALESRAAALRIVEAKAVKAQAS